MYLVVVGAGQIGTNLIELAVGDGNDVVVIERDEARAEAASATYDCLVLNADATKNGTLQDAEIERADAVISTTDVDAVNIMVMLLAREHDVPNLISVVHDRDHIPIFEKIGATLIENPQRLIADYLYHSVRYPGVKDFIELSNDTELIEVTVERDAPVDGRRIEQAKEAGIIPDDALVVALEAGGEIISPRGDTRITSGDEVTVVTHDADLQETVAAFTVDDEQA